MDSNEKPMATEPQMSGPVEKNMTFWSKNKMPLMALAAIVIILLGALAIFFVTQSDDDEDSDDSNTEQVDRNDDDEENSEAGDSREENPDTDDILDDDTPTGTTTGSTESPGGAVSTTVPEELREALEATASATTSYQIDFLSGEGDFVIKFDASTGNHEFNMTFGGETIQMFTDSSHSYINYGGQWIKTLNTDDISDSLAILNPTELSNQLLSDIEGYDQFIQTENVNCFNVSGTCKKYSYTDESTNTSGYVTLNVATNLLDKLIIEGANSAQMDFTYSNVSVVIPAEALNAIDYSQL